MRLAFVIGFPASTQKTAAYFPQHCSLPPQFISSSSSSFSSLPLLLSLFLVSSALLGALQHLA